MRSFSFLRDESRNCKGEKETREYQKKFEGEGRLSHRMVVENREESSFQPGITTVLSSQIIDYAMWDRDWKNKVMKGETSARLMHFSSSKRNVVIDLMKSWRMKREKCMNHPRLIDGSRFKNRGQKNSRKQRDLKCRHNHEDHNMNPAPIRNPVTANAD